MGKFFYSQKKYIEAVPFFEKALAIDKTPLNMTFLLQTHFNIGDAEKVEVLIRRSKILFPAGVIKRRGHPFPEETSAVIKAPPLLPGDMEFYFQSQPKKKPFPEE